MRDNKLSNPGKHPLFDSLSTFTLVLIGWVIFRAESLNQLGWFLLTMANPGKLFCTFSPDLTNNILFFMMLGVFLSVMSPQWLNGPLKPYLGHRWVKFGMIILLFICCLGKIAIASFKSFIYFRF